MSMLLGHMFSWFPVQATTYCLSTVSWIVCHSPLPLSYSASPENQQSQGLCAETSEIRNQNKFFTSYFEILEIHHSENSNTHLKKNSKYAFPSVHFNVVYFRTQFFFLLLQTSSLFFLSNTHFSLEAFTFFSSLSKILLHLPVLSWEFKRSFPQSLRCSSILGNCDQSFK